MLKRISLYTSLYLFLAIPNTFAQNTSQTMATIEAGIDPFPKVSSFNLNAIFNSRHELQGIQAKGEYLSDKGQWKKFNITRTTQDIVKAKYVGVSFLHYIILECPHLNKYNGGDCFIQFPTNLKYTNYIRLPAEIKKAYGQWAIIPKNHPNKIVKKVFVRPKITIPLHEIATITLRGYRNRVIEKIDVQKTVREQREAKKRFDNETIYTIDPYHSSPVPH